MPILSKTELFKILPSEAHDVVFKAHRLNELRRLQGREQTQSFIDDRGIVSLFTGTELPSIQEAIEGTLASDTHDGIIKSGFGIAWIWAQDLPDPSRCMYCLFLREKATFIARRHWASLIAMGSPNHHQARKAKHISAIAYQLANYIETQGPTSGDLLRKALGHTGRAGGQTFRRARRELEKQWIIVPIGIGEHRRGADPHTWELTGRWLPPHILEEALALSRQEAMANILLAGIDATLAVDEQAVFRWFGWTRSITGRLVKGLLEREACFRVDGSNPILISQTLVDAWPRV